MKIVTWMMAIMFIGIIIVMIGFVNYFRPKTEAESLYSVAVPETADILNFTPTAPRSENPYIKRLQDAKKTIYVGLALTAIGGISSILITGFNPPELGLK